MSNTLKVDIEDVEHLIRPRSDIGQVCKQGTILPRRG